MYSSASNMWYHLLLPVIVAGSLADSPDATLYAGASGAARAPHKTEQVDLEQNSEDLERMRQDEWAHAELTYGLVRPDSTGVIYVHRMPHSSFALTPHSWESIVVGHNWVPDEILSDIARWHNDIFDQWEAISCGCAASTDRPWLHRTPSCQESIMCLFMVMIFSTLINVLKDSWSWCSGMISSYFLLCYQDGLTGRFCKPFWCWELWAKATLLLWKNNSGPRSQFQQQHYW